VVYDSVGTENGISCLFMKSTFHTGNKLVAALALARACLYQTWAAPKIWVGQLSEKCLGQV